MNLSNLINHAADKKRFNTLSDYTTFCSRYLEFIETGLQARIISQNERKYLFFQYREEGSFNITRPLNSQLMLTAEEFSAADRQLRDTIEYLKAGQQPEDSARTNLIRSIYTLQQSIGATLDALPAGESNRARKVNGDLFEQLIRIIITMIGIECFSGTVKVPVKDIEGHILFRSSYQHDLIISQNSELKVIGSVKTSSKDRIDKVFLDKFLYSKLTNTSTPHIAIFLNDVQRKKNKKENNYSINSTFLPGHFKAYTIKLNPLDGVYYCDIRQNMTTDTILSQHIKTIDHFFYSDIWDLISNKGLQLSSIAINKNK